MIRVKLSTHGVTSKSLRVPMASTREEALRGLRGLQLGSQIALLFRVSPETWFVMDGVTGPLEVIEIDNGCVSRTRRIHPSLGTFKTKTVWVLEAGEGFMEAHGIRKGSKIQLTFPDGEVAF